MWEINGAEGVFVVENFDWGERAKRYVALVQDWRRDDAGHWGDWSGPLEVFASDDLALVRAYCDGLADAVNEEEGAPSGEEVRVRYLEWNEALGVYVGWHSGA